MASGTPTTNLGLRTMTDADSVDAQDINYNSGVLDAKIGAVGSTSLQSQVTALNDNVTSLRYATSLGTFSSLGELTGALDTKLQSMSQSESLPVWFQTGSSAVETIGSYVRCEGYLQCVYVSGTRKDATVIFTGNDGTEVHLSKLNGNWRYNDINAKIGNAKTIFVQLFNQTINGSSSSIGITTFDLSSYIPQGYQLWSAEVQIQNSNNFYNLPWFNDGLSQATWIERISSTSVVVKNKATWASNTSVTFTLHCKM
jgi:hypothetical protein